MNDLVSVIVPMYNAEQYIEKTIQSVLDQTHRNFELLLIDDCSIDNTLKKTQRFLSDSRVIVFEREKNYGLSSARQFGIDHSNGVYFVTIDSDDYISPLFIEKLLCTIVSENADVAVCSRYDFSNEIYVERKIELEKKVLQITSSMLTEKYTAIANQLVLSDSWNKMYRVGFVRESGVNFELDKKYKGNDFAFNYKLVMHQPKYAILNEPLIFHRILPGSMAHKLNLNVQEGFNTIIEQLIVESRICNLQMNDELTIVYFDLLYVVFTGFVLYSKSMKDCISYIRQYIKQHADFARKHPFLNKTIKKRIKKTIFYVSILTQKKSLFGLSCLCLYLRKINSQAR